MAARKTFTVLLFRVLVLLLAGRAGLAQGIARLDCMGLSGLRLPGVEMTVSEARVVAAGPFTAGANRAPLDLPEHCLLRAEIDPRTGVGGIHYGIGFELRMPVRWNEGFFFQGGGGMDGLVRPAVGTMPNNGSTAAVALARGYAVASTDAGHEGLDGSFGADQQARIDYYYAAIERVTDVSRQVLTRLYGMPLKRSYFVGCSNGGRQGLLAAERFPMLFDGVVAGAPAFDLTRAAVAELWEDRTYLNIAPKDAAGKAILSKAFSNADLKALADSLLEKCDALDGAKDGMIENPTACHYDPAVLACLRGKADGCLTGDQVAALKTAFAGPKTSAGKAIYSDWAFDTGIAAAGWRQWKLGTSETAQSNALNVTLGVEATKSIHRDVYRASLDLGAFDFDTAAEDSRMASGMEDAGSTMMSSFAGHGGKLLLFTGMSDPIFSANDLIRFYGKIVADNGGEATTQGWARLFLVPGMTHCGGGPSLDDFDPLAALELWVEKGVAPDMKAKGKAFPGRVRKMCAYPDHPHYRGKGSLEEDESFACRQD